VEIEDALLSIFLEQKEDPNQEEIKLNNYINSLLEKSLERKSKSYTSTDATSFDLIIIEGINQ